MNAVVAPALKADEQRKVFESKHFHATNLVRAAVDEAARTVEIAWASAESWERWWGIEVLRCDAKSVRLGRLKNGAPLLFNHDFDRILGVVEKVWIGDDKVCRAVVRFAKTAQAEEFYQMVLDGILNKVSVGYRIHSRILISEKDGVETYEVDDWEPHEISMVSVPADDTVGVGRSAQKESSAPAPAEPVQPLSIKPEIRVMENEVKPDEKLVADLAGKNADIKRRDAIIELGARYADYLTLKDVQTACTNGDAVEKVQELVMEKMKTKHTDTRGVQIGMEEKDVGRYSIAKAVRAILIGDWKEAGLERAASEACAQRFGSNSGQRAFYLPMDMMAKRDFTVGTAAEAGNLVTTTLRTDMFADILRNRLALGRLGVTMLNGLTGNIDLPRKTVGSSLGFVTEIAAAAETQPNTGKVTMSPKRIGGFIEFSKQAVIQSAIAVEPMLRQDVIGEYAVQVETAAINGSGTLPNPRGIRNWPGIGSVVGGANGLLLNWAKTVEMETAVANVNAEPDAQAGYLINTRTRGAAKTIQKATNLPFIWDNGGQPLNSYRAEVTNIMPNTLTKGTSTGVCSSMLFSSDWGMSVIGTFGAVEILVDEVTNAVNGMNRLILNAFIDHALRRAADFAVMDDLLTV